ncbi:MAG: CarD family transcriptional regulator, partial [bacterium]|nr:CarD family transcriptional regulator [bacterium]
RGGIIDIFSPSSDLPVRIELFGNQVESLRRFDPVNQRSLGPVEQAIVVPATEMLLPEPGHVQLEALLNQMKVDDCPAEARERITEELARLLEGHDLPRREYYAPLFGQGSLLDYLPETALLIVDEPADIQATTDEIDAHARELRQALVERGELPPGFPVPYFQWTELEPRLEQVEQRLALSQWWPGDAAPQDSHVRLLFTSPPSYGGRLPAFLSEAKAMLAPASERGLAQGHRLVVASHQARRLAELLAEEDLFAVPTTEPPATLAAGSLTLLQGSLAQGWAMPEHRVVLFTDTEVFGFTKQPRLEKRRPVRNRVFISELEVGDYVVHVEHGVARFAGMARMARDGGEREFLVLEYASGDKLYVPSDQVDRVGRYLGPTGEPPALSRLGSQEWSRTKQRVKESALALAKEMLSLYAAREVVPGVAFSPDTVWQQELEAAFPYVETPDQMAVQWQVKADMEQPRPMDRLVCGDVGYGKTEVA